MKITVLGCGDAFGSGGRLQTCFSVQVNDFHLLVDCGATVLTAMQRYGVEPASVDAVLLSHLHGDHYAGLPLLDLFLRTQRRRHKPLLVMGPSQLESRLSQLSELLFPGTSGKERPFALEVRDYAQRLGPFNLQSYPVHHEPLTQPHALRLEHQGKVLAYSGDTAWTDVLVEASRDADLFLCECVAYEKPLRDHLSFVELQSRKLACRRLMLTHMGDEMLSRLPLPQVETAEEGLVIEL